MSDPTKLIPCGAIAEVHDISVHDLSIVLLEASFRANRTRNRDAESREAFHRGLREAFGIVRPADAGRISRRRA
jgi:hypothetical protein